VSFDLWFLNRFVTGPGSGLVDFANNHSLLGIGTVLLVGIMVASRLRGRL